jgi:DNA-directed RNA polymerase specialized sigma24 family protein
MQTLRQASESGADLYWLAYLLTGDRGPSLDLALEALVPPDDGSTFFSTWMLAWSRRMFIAKALGAIRGELAESARRTAFRRGGRVTLPPRNWTLDGETTKTQLEKAILAIDVFPRCVVVLSVFEGVLLQDVATLVDSDLDLVVKARAIGVRELTRDLAQRQGWTSIQIETYLPAGELQHA